MCFSAAVSFVASAIIGLIGILTLTKVKSKKHYFFAIIPILFAIQQFTEGVIWLSFDSPNVLNIMTYVYTFFSHILWPTYIPLAVLMLENKPIRKKILSTFLAIGILVSLYFSYYTIVYPVTAQIVNFSIQYNYHHHFIGLALAIYILVVSASCIFSSKNFVKIFGLLVFASFVLAYLFYTATVISVWCFFAAIISTTIYGYFCNKNR